jgi:ATP-dependent 26S proteasome regulatory subunit
MLPELRRLDFLLHQAVRRVPETFGVNAGADPLRGLHTSATDAENLFAQVPGSPLFGAGAVETSGDAQSQISDSARWLMQAYGLTSFDLDIVLLALSPELDRRYERIFGYLHDDVSRRWPTVDLALNLFCLTAADRLAQRARFAPNSPLVEGRLIRLFGDAHQGQPPLLAQYIKLDEQIVHWLLCRESFDARLVPFARLVHPSLFFDQLSLDSDTERVLRTITALGRAQRRPVRLYFHGLHPVSQFQAAEALARETGMRLLRVDVQRLIRSAGDLAESWALVFREAWFKNAVLYLENVDSARREERESDYRILLDAVADHGGITILSGAEPWLPARQHPLGVVSVAFLMPAFAERRDCWQRNLASHGLEIAHEDLNRLAETFRLTPEQIADAAATVRNRANGQTAAVTAQRSTSADLFAAARAQSGHHLARLAVKVEPRYRWKDIVLPADTLAQLREICDRVGHRQRVFGEWGFDRKLSLGKGVTALFAGPSGTGKTMAAEVIANELGLDLYKIDLSMIVSKYIGETEKNLSSIFQEARDSNVILFFDEADALFGKRSEVKDAHDRYANIEIAFLLQKMDEYEGIVILATNLRHHMDEAFARRMQAIVDFPFPEADYRRQIFEGIFPHAAPLSADVDFACLARQFKVTGGNIKNIALHAAFLAASGDKRIGMAQIIRAMKREFQKVGKLCSKAEFGPYYDLIASSEV